jgi:hypothetical protein
MDSRAMEPPVMTEARRIVMEWTLARDEAETLLRSLTEAKAESEKRLADFRQRDPLKAVTGRSSIDNAIASTQRMLATFDRLLAQAKRDLSDDDAAVLEDAVAAGR